MKFCPTCKIRLKKDNDVLTCPKCKHEEPDKNVVKKTVKEKEDKEPEISEFNVFDANEGSEILPTIKILCEKCGHDKAVWWMLQTRSADEPTTQFYRCAMCSHTWRNYD